MPSPLGSIYPSCSWVSCATLPTKYGEFTIHAFDSSSSAVGQDCKEHIALVYGTVARQEGVAVRVHSECITSEVFGSLKCDCKAQLDAAMEYITAAGRGVVLYLRQEGRGIGLANKIRAYELQASGHDTVDANRMLGLPDDARDYNAAADILNYLQVKNIRLLTNNPHKITALEALGIAVVERISLITPSNPHSFSYLETKRQRMAHHLPDPSIPPPPSAPSLEKPPAHSLLSPSNKRI